MTRICHENVPFSPTPVHRVIYLHQDAKVYLQQLQKFPVSLGTHIKLSNFKNKAATALKILEFVLSRIFSVKSKKLGKQAIFNTATRLLQLQVLTALALRNFHLF